ncbi:hypothetical protein BC826DRAFT_1109969 [Russula brevipes]|nr:hypothetical protein BC826DRAFT_1109969 [Russula brevipes]
MSGGGGGGDGDDFGAWVTNAPPPLGPDEDDPMPSVPPHRSDPSTMRAMRPPTSGGGGVGDGDFGAWATNAPPPLRPPEKDDDDPMPSALSTARAARPPTSGSGGDGDGDVFSAWVTNAPPPLGPNEDDPMLSVPHTDPTPRPRALPIHLRVAAVVAATATTLHHKSSRTTRSSSLSSWPHGHLDRVQECVEIQSEHLFCNFFPSSYADPPPTLDSDANLELLEITLQPIVCILVLRLTLPVVVANHQPPGTSSRHSGFKLPPPDKDHVG